MNIFTKILSPIIRPLVEAEIERIITIDPPKIKKIRVSKVIKDKPTVWDILPNDYVDISLCIRWIDDNGLEDFKVYPAQDVADLKYMMNHIKPEYELFSDVSLHVKPPRSTSSVIENLVDYKFSRHEVEVYDSDQLPEVFSPVIEWIENKPELLI